MTLVLCCTKQFYFTDMRHSKVIKILWVSGTCLILVICVDGVHSVFYHYSASYKSITWGNSLKKTAEIHFWAQISHTAEHWSFTKWILPPGIKHCTHSFCTFLVIFYCPAKHIHRYPQVYWGLWQSRSAPVSGGGDHWKLDMQVPTRQQKLDVSSSLFRLLPCSSDVAKKPLPACA